MIDSRSDLSLLKTDHPALAERCETLRWRLSREIDDHRSPVQDKLLKKRREAAHEIDHCLLEIRQISSHKNFLSKPTVGELRDCATGGPIILVNVTDISADAIIISPSKVKAVSLPLSLAETVPQPFRQASHSYSSARRGDYGRDIGDDAEEWIEPGDLSWLWSNCVKLILDELEAMSFFNPQEPPRVWWVGSGIASSFPFHAAGLHFGSSWESTLSRVAPSYSPTIKTLGYSRQRASTFMQSEDKNLSVLVIAMPTTPGQKPLGGVDREERVIETVCQWL